MSLPPITFATDIELRDAAFAEKLARRRRLLLRFSLPVVIIAALVSAKFLSAVALNLIGTSSYDRANYSTAAERYSNTQVVNIVQPWKAHYNEGTAHYSAGKFFTAGQHLQVALDKVPKAPEDQPRGAEECMVRVNYSLALEGTAAETLAVGDASMAEAYYDRALEMLDDCADSGEGGETAEDAQDRQEQGRDEAREQQQEYGEDEEPADPDSGEGDPDEGEDEQPAQPEEDPQQQELEERNQKANEDDSSGDDGGTGLGDGSGQNW